MAEAHVVARAVTRMLECGVDPEAVGVICFYRAQVNAIRRALQTQVSEVPLAQASLAPSAPTAGQSCPQPSGDGAARKEPGALAEPVATSATVPRGRDGGVQVATVDSFQGAEKEIIFLATTVSRAADFAADAKRLNVALTRGRRHLLVVGAPSALSQTSAVFKEIIRTCQDAMRDSQHQQQQQSLQERHAAASGATAGTCHALYVSAAGLHRLLASLDAPACGPLSPHPTRQTDTLVPRRYDTEMLPPRLSKPQQHGLPLTGPIAAVHGQAQQQQQQQQQQQAAWHEAPACNLQQQMHPPASDLLVPGDNAGFHPPPAWRQMARNVAMATASSSTPLQQHWRPAAQERDENVEEEEWVPMDWMDE
ncbi:hypothetical protein Vretifemale_13824 [Volvox reticuliferus]|uniref:DNA2/NAM7 helicase-like C-terminal domain-containing protein n=1 Tax=Volvox reticuliferus TaxID=1737510 RepID=A0A8J4CRQ2_9CHLO|nr:hypothetical protein Vretifemale_13824 [Volvox reticuliferus]